MTAEARNGGDRDPVETERVVMEEEEEELAGTEEAGKQVVLSREDYLFQSTSMQHESLLTLMSPALRANAPRNVVPPVNPQPMNPQVLMGVIDAVLAELEDFPLIEDFPSI